MTSNRLRTLNSLSMPNNTLVPTGNGEAPLLAAQRRRWALPMATLERMRNPVVLCPRPPQPPVLAGDRFPLSFPRSVSRHRPACVRARAVDALSSSGACSSRRSVTKERVRFSGGRVLAPRPASEVMAMLVPALSSTSAHTAFALLSSAGAVPGAAPNHAFEGTACQRRCASLRPAAASPRRSRRTAP